MFRRGLLKSRTCLEKGVDTMKSRAVLWMLLGPVTAIVTAVTMMIMFVALVTGGLALMAAAWTAYLKREDWTLPAYRWARDRTGSWRLTPWSSNGAEAVQEDTSVQA